MTFGTNLLLAVLWAALIGPFSPANLLIGFVVGFGVLRVCSLGEGRPTYSRRAWATVKLALFTLRELMVANVRVALYTLSRLGSLSPAVLEVPMEADLTDAEITLISSLITLTPGTLTLDVSDDRRFLYVHFMHLDDAEGAVAEIK